MGKRIIVGIIGGMLYTLFTWVVAFLNVIHWIKRRDAVDEIVMTDFAAPFSLIAIFVFLTLYAFHKWQPEQRSNKTFFNLWIIGLMFSIGATATLVGLSYLDATANTIILSSFFLVCLFIATLTCSFYLFLKPRKGHPDQEKLDEVFSNL